MPVNFGILRTLVEVFAVVSPTICARFCREAWNKTGIKVRTLQTKLFISLLAAVLSIAVLQPAWSAETVELVPSKRVIIKITSEMTLDRIIERIYPRDKDLWPQIKDKLIETNPSSFVQYSDRLIPGTRLKLVDVKRIFEQEQLAPKIRVGYVSRVDGDASATDDTGRIQVMQNRTPVYEGDRIKTEPRARMEIVMDDGARIHIKEDSVVKITEYVITAGYDENSSSVLDLLRGGFRKITGSIGASAVANYQVQTGLATIGIRGTDYVLKMCKQDDCSQTVSRNDPDAKLHAVVLEGAITLTTDDDVRILMAMGEYGTATADTLKVEEQVPVPVGFLDPEESQHFDISVEQRVESAAAEEPSKTWMWIVGALLLAVGL